MAEIVDMIDKIKRYFKFTPLEIRSIIIAILVVAFIISFKEWGYGTNFSLRIGLFNYFNAILIVALSLLVHISAQRLWSLGTGYRLEWKIWSFGLLFGLILAFLTNGLVWMILPGGFIVHHMAGHRLGWFRYGINYVAVGLIALSGIFATMFLAVIFKALSAVIVNSLIQKIIVFNIAFALYSLLPIPPMDGSKTFFGSRMIYAFTTTVIIAMAILLNSSISIGIVIISSLFIGVVLWLLYYIFFEHKAWKD
jgi:Zn-dependent protease|tara:strand:+ start:3314 stop:4069 length:756 start_codon:yes stop_codon:yes gene_type:complete